jgi:hypothetical protein
MGLFNRSIVLLSWVLTFMSLMNILKNVSNIMCFVGGVVAAFLQAIVGNNTCFFNDVFTNYESAPVSLEVPQQKGELPQNHNLQVPLKDE